MERRQFLIVGSAFTTSFLAGCSGTDGDGNDGDSSGSGNESDGGSGNDNSSGNESDSGDENSTNEADAQDALESEDTESTVEGLEISEHELYTEEFEAGVEGVVVNNTGDELGYVEVGVVFYNSDGQRIDDSFTNTSDLPDGEEWAFDVMFLGDDPDDIDDYSIAVTDTPF